MKNKVFKNPGAAAVLVAAVLSLAAQAQGIDRVKMTDNDLSCQQIYGEISQMDGVIAKAGQPGAPAAPVADAGVGVGTQVAGAVAQTAIANSVARSGFGGFGGFGNAAGGLGGLFGGMAQQAAQNNANQQAAAQQAAAQQGALLAQQAQGRKEHLTGLFLGKGCKMSDIQK